MKVVILAEGLGTRISEKTHLESKSMIENGALQNIGFKNILRNFNFYENKYWWCCFSFHRFAP